MSWARDGSVCGLDGTGIEVRFQKRVEILSVSGFIYGGALEDLLQRDAGI